MLLWAARARAADPVALTADITVDEITSSIRILSGADPLDGSPIASRNVHHPDAVRAAAWLEDQLTAMGLSPGELPFPMDGVDPSPRDIVA